MVDKKQENNKDKENYREFFRHLLEDVDEELTNEFNEREEESSTVGFGCK